MTPHAREEALALYSTGDLEERELMSIAEHLDNCAECRDRLSRFEQVHGMLASVAGEPSAEDLLEVRQRVMGALGGTRKRRWSLQWAAGVAALAALVLLFQQKRHSGVEMNRPPARTATIQHAPEAAELSRNFVREIPVLRRGPHLRAAGLRSIALTGPTEEAVIKITTSDPKVVILLPPDIQNDERTETND